MITCTSCNSTNIPGEAFCDNCGTTLEGMGSSVGNNAPPAHPNIASYGEGCPNCAKIISADMTFCDDCGTQLNQPPSPQQPASNLPKTVLVGESKPVPAPANDTCVQCQGTLFPEDLFCGHCGTKIAVEAPLPTPVHQPRLVMQDSGTSLEFPPHKASLIIGREDPQSNQYPDINLEPHDGARGGISRLHAKLDVTDSRYLIEDLASTNGTSVNRTRLTPYIQHPISHGDEVRLGRITFIFYTE